MINRGEPALVPVRAGDPLPALRIGEEIDDDIAVVVTTSGTTGAPKGAQLTAAALTASANATHARLGGPGAGCWRCLRITSPACKCSCAVFWPALCPSNWTFPRVSISTSYPAR
ncbi:AMP-binding enzyme family protein [Mycobacterium xenopi 3993]|nr:AMP-binding enzyme family protein [Mycobacterium xenopi 3993]